MKIAIESNDGVTIKSPFLRTRGYVVYEIDEAAIRSSEYREDKKNEAENTGADLVRASSVSSLLKDCCTVISRGMDRDNLNLLKQEGKEVFITFKTSAQDAVKLYIRELLITNKLPH